MSNDVLGRFVWHELLTTDTAAAASFYPKVVPWRTQPSNMPGYTIWMAAGVQVGGLMALPAEAAGTPPHWLIYVGTPNVDATCAQAQGLGARVVKPPSDIPNVGRFAVLADPQGATFALFTPASATAPSAPGPGGFSWHELATTDLAAAVRFYGTLFGWTKGAGHDMGAMGLYQLFEHGGNQVGGMCNVQGPSTPPSWLSYVNVAESSKAVAAAKGAGGRLLHGPIEVPGGSWIALMMDPQGGAFAVQEAPRTAARPAAPAVPAKAAPKPAAAKAAPAPAPKAAAPTAKPAAAKPKPAKKKTVKKKTVKKKPAKKPVAKRRPARKKAASKAVRKAKRPGPRRTRRAPKKRARRRR